MPVDRETGGGDRTRSKRREVQIFESLLQTSGDGAYAKQAKAVSKVFEASVRNPKHASPPSVIADADAVTSRRPKTRYVVGSGARPLLLARRVLTDRGFDRMLALGYRFAR